MNFLPSVKEVLFAMQEYDIALRSQKLINLEKPEFPLLCFETSLLIYLWIRLKDNENIPKLVVGAYSCSNNGPSKNNFQEDNNFHIWIEYKNKIIDYTHIQFMMGRNEQKPTPIKVLEQQFKLDKLEFEFDLKNPHFTENVPVVLFPDLEILVEDLINSYNFSTFYDLFYVYTNKIIELQYYFYKENNLFYVFDLLPQVLNWCLVYDLNTYHNMITQHTFHVELIDRYITQCEKDGKFIGY